MSTNNVRNTCFDSMMIKIAAVGLCFCLLVGCAAPPSQPQYYPEQAGRRDAASEEFRHRIHYPYQASKARQHQIEVASRQVHVYMSEAQVLALLGPPDIKTDYDGYPPKIPPSQTWAYIHTATYRAKPDYQGKVLYVTFSATTPRTVTSVHVPNFKGPDW